MADTRRDQLSEAYDQHVEQEPAPEKAVPEADPSSLGATEPEPSKLGRTAGRQRDEKGRLLPGPAVRTEPAAGQEKAPTAQIPEQATQSAPAAAKVHPSRPSSWKKEMWDHWGKLDPSVAEYINQRESEYAKGVSTYKQEWENAKPLIEAMSPFLPLLQQHNINPGQWISNLGNAHKTLALGTPEQKLGAFIRLAGEYRIPLEQMFVRGQDGQVYLNQQYLAAQQAAPQSQQQPQTDPRQLFKEMLAEEKAYQQLEAMKSDTKAYPHFEVVRETMAGLLRAGLAQDYPSAYEAALRMPQHSDIFDAIQQQKREQEDREKAEAQRKAAEAARRANVSLKSATPASTGQAQPKGRRAQLEQAFDEHMSGRV